MTTATPCLARAHAEGLDRPVVRLMGLSKRFGHRSALADVSLEIRPGEVLGLLGHNGAGKTTTIRLLTGLLVPSAGEVLIFDRSPGRDGPEIRARIGVVGEHAGLDERLTARENLEIFAELFAVPSAVAAPRVAELLAAFGLAGRADDRVAGFSTGMRQRLALARALLPRPDLLLLDEPTAGLDPVAARDVHALVARQRDEGRTVLLCTHNLAEAQHLCDRVAVLERGRLLALGSPAELAREVAPRGRLEIEVGRDATAWARALLGAELGDRVDAHPRRGTVTVTAIPRDRIPGLIADLVAAGIPVYRVTPEEPSLEDVYFALHHAGSGP